MHQRSRSSSSAALLLALGCGAGVAPAPVASAQAPEGHDEPPGVEAALEPVAPGAYRLEMSAACPARELVVTGTLTLSPIGGAEDAAPGADAVLLWGQTDLDLAALGRCLGETAAAPGDPIHPGVLVEVLRWDGARGQQVLLVSAQSPRPDGPGAAVGVAMWVEQARSGRLAGSWSRWQLMGRGEGRWHAERVGP